MCSGRNVGCNVAIKPNKLTVNFKQLDKQLGKMKKLTMLSYDGKFSFYCFLISFSIVFLILIESVCVSCSKFIDAERNIWWLIPTYYVLLNIFFFVFCRGFTYKVAIRSGFLGTVFGIGIYVLFYGPKYWDRFGLYLCVMSFFHYSEFLAIAWCNPSTLSVNSFMLNHSTEYCAAAIASWIEFATEMYFYPQIKRFNVISLIGFFLCVFGEILRKLAMVTAKTNFNHIVQTEKEDGHELVTHGVYSLFRHPSYVGWFYWCIGTQVLLLNPICIVAYALASWKFFNIRIESEEQALIYFFAEDYVKYQKSVGTGLPGIRGYIIDE